MAGADFQIRAAGEGEVERQLAGLHSRLGDLTPLMDIIGTILTTDAEDNFEGEHTPEGVPWPPSIRVQEHGGKTLQLSRRLRLSLTHRAWATGVEAGTNVVYANRHQHGFQGTEQISSFKRVMRMVYGVTLAEPIEVTVGAHSRHADTPARPFLGMSVGARGDILAAAADYVGMPQ